MSVRRSDAPYKSGAARGDDGRDGEGHLLQDPPLKAASSGEARLAVASSPRGCRDSVTGAPRDGAPPVTCSRDGGRRFGDAPARASSSLTTAAARGKRISAEAEVPRAGTIILDSDGSSDGSDFVGQRSERAPRRPQKKMVADPTFCTTTLREAVRNFSPLQRRLVKDCKFGFLLELPRLGVPNRPFLAWLYSRIHVGRGGSMVMELDKSNRVAITAEWVERVFGLPTEGKEIKIGRPNSQHDSWKTVLWRLNHGRGNSGRQSVTVPRAAVALGQLVGDETPGVKEEEFLTALLIYAVGNLLAPRAPNTKFDGGVIQAAAEPKSAGSFNWADYIIKVLAKSVPNVHDRLRESGVAGFQEAESGCALLLQVIYLHSFLPHPIGLRRQTSCLFSRYHCGVVDELIKADAERGTNHSLDNAFAGIRSFFQLPSFSRMPNLPVQKAGGETTAVPTEDLPAQSKKPRLEGSDKEENTFQDDVIRHLIEIKQALGLAGSHADKKLQCDIANELDNAIAAVEDVPFVPAEADEEVMRGASDLFVLANSAQKLHASCRQDDRNNLNPSASGSHGQTANNSQMADEAIVRRGKGLMVELETNTNTTPLIHDMESTHEDIAAKTSKCKERSNPPDVALLALEATPGSRASSPLAIVPYTQPGSSVCTAALGSSSRHSNTSDSPHTGTGSMKREVHRRRSIKNVCDCIPVTQRTPPAAGLPTFDATPPALIVGTPVDSTTWKPSGMGTLRTPSWLKQPVLSPELSLFTDMAGSSRSISLNSDKSQHNEMYTCLSDETVNKLVLLSPE
ncbi:hypothetical protein ACP70R_011936 [Stipagrostis hirtigluma subsp. patula]